MASIGEKILSGVFWQGLSSFLNIVIGFIISVILARLLTPDDFGTIAIISSVISLLGSFLDIGLGSSLIQKKELTNEDCSCVFLLNIGMACIVYVTIFVLSYYIADFYHRSELKLCIQVLALTLPIRSISMVQGTIIFKRMYFALNFRITIISVLCSGVVGIVLAFIGLKYWAIIIQQIISALVSGTLIWFYGRWKPIFYFDIKRICSLLNYGGKLFLSGLLDNWYENLYSMAIGKFFSFSILSFYNRGQHLAKMGLGSIYGAIGSTFFPIFSEIQDDDVKLKKLLLSSERNIMFILIPSMCLLVVIADPLIYIVYGEKWMRTVPFLQFFAINSLFFPLSSLNLQLLMAKGRSDEFLKLEIIKKIISIILIIILFRFGIYTLLLGQLAFSVIAFFLNSRLSGRLLKLSSLTQLKYLSFYFFLSFFSIVICESFLFMAKNINPFFKLFLSSGIFLLIYLGGCILLKRIPKEIFEYLKNKYIKIRG